MSLRQYLNKAQPLTLGGILAQRRPMFRSSRPGKDTVIYFMRARNISGAPALELVRRVSVAALIGAAFTFAVLCIMALLMSVRDIPTSAASAMSSAAAGVGAFAAGFAAAKIHKRQGAVIGAASGTLLFLIIFVVSMIITGTFLSLSVFLRFILMLLASTVAGIMGVNMRVRRKKF